MTKKIKSSLLVNGLELIVSLGWPKNERLQEQIVLLDLNIHFSEPLKACETDNLDDTYCYANLASLIREKIAARTFRLIEHLTYEIYNIVKSTLPATAKINVSITKKPSIKGLQNGVCFSYGDGE